MTRKSANIGPGHFVKISTVLEAFIKAVTVKNVYNCQILRRSGESYEFDKDMDSSLCEPEKVKKSSFKMPGTVEITENDKNSNAESENEPEDISEAKPDDKGSLYKCPNDLCTADYIRFHNFARHISEGVCKARLRSMSQMNHAKILWFNRFGIQDKSKLNDESRRYFKTHLDQLQEIVLPTDIELVANYDGFRYDEPLIMGYAMKVNNKLPKITEKLDTFVKDLFDKGQITGQKYTPAQMKKEIHKKFPLKEWLTWSQVKGGLISEAIFTMITSSRKCEKSLSSIFQHSKFMIVILNIVLSIGSK